MGAMKRLLTPSERSWQQNLRRIWDAKKRELKLTQESAGAAMGITQGAVGQYLNGVIPLNTNSKLRFAEILRVPPSEIDPELFKQPRPTINSVEDGAANYTFQPIHPWDSGTDLEDDEVEVPLFMEVELSAGSGMTHIVESNGPKIRFSRSTMRRASVEPSAAACCFATGDSMGAVVPDGACVGVDTAFTKIIDGEIYAIEHGGLLRIKYLFRLPNGGVRIRSENREEYPDEILFGDDLKDFRVIGYVFWVSSLRTRRS